MGKALLSDPQNNIRKGQELGTGITQKIYKLGLHRLLVESGKDLLTNFLNILNHAFVISL